MNVSTRGEIHNCVITSVRANSKPHKFEHNVILPKGNP